MDIAHILEDLAYDNGSIPREAIEAAVVKKERITPCLLQILADAVERIDEIIEDDNYQGHLYAMYLLAQFREIAAYPLVLKMMSFPGEIPYAVAGDVLTEDLSRIIAAVSPSDIHMTHDLIENHGLNEYVRAAAQASLVVLVGAGYKNRDEVLDYFKELLSWRLERKYSFVWDNLVACCCSLYPDTVYDLLVVAFNDGLINTSFISIEDVNAILSEQDKNSCLSGLCGKTELIEDTLSEMEKWIENCPV
ncbi:hypothetical protein CLAVI_000823 [Candidatus Clavichlamydia salmonicola]|uniref:DUF1186 domain-containing protein n=1 Tax=Candidatus Clavichlamydia salmonicola TaxID=469812 RepID=UPI001891E2D8|nr:DUF1186 domain-containing protein [Candidatus Clavichlamydia salmonicola]MBF5051185.1 hypothetical protein [Candidatus Clavichlamydia salmonicola]